MQIEPNRFNKGLKNGFHQIIAQEGMSGLTTGLGPTVVGYFVQGFFKFGGVEFFKINIVDTIGEQSAWENRTAIYLGASAMAEFIADIFLCPLEATRIRLVSNPSFADGLFSGASRLMKEEGLLKGFYSGFAPILLKQVPYTMAKFAVQGNTAEYIANSPFISQDVSQLQGGVKLGVSLLVTLVS